MISDSIVVFVSIFFCILIDFWVTKNITGRYLVGLRWWTDMDENDNTENCYECFDYEIKFNYIDVQVFWWGLGAIFIFWTILLLIKIFGLDLLWVLLTGIGSVLNWMNLEGYYRCRQGNFLNKYNRA